MRPRKAVVGGLQVAVALLYGAILGSWLPLPAGQPVFALPVIVETSPLPRDLQARPEHASVGPSAAQPASGSPGRNTWLSATEGQSADALDAWAFDTLPAAPTTPVTPLAGRPLAAAGVTQPIRTPSAARGGATCPAIIVEGSSVLPECRTATQRRLRSLCPSPGDARPTGPIACIRPEP